MPEQKVISAARAFIKNENPDTYSRLFRAVQRLDGKDVAEEPRVWTWGAWEDVRSGDRVRMGEEEAVAAGPKVSEDGAIVTTRLIGYLEIFTFAANGGVEILAEVDRKTPNF